MTSEATSPASESSAATRVSDLPGSVRIDRPANRSTLSKVIEPRPPGSSKVSPGRSRMRSWSAPSLPGTGVIEAVSRE